MRAGQLDRVIEIQDIFEDAVDEYGTPTRTKSGASLKVRAQMLSYDTTNREGARPTTEQSITFRVYWIEGLSLESHVLYDGQVFKILKIREIGRRAGLDLVVDRVGP
jgi:hypothetical protein